MPYTRTRSAGSGSGLPGLDEDAVSWALRVQTNGGTYTAGTLAAVNNFCVSMKASGVWPKCNRLNLFCGDQLAAALVPLKIGNGNTTDTNVNFVGGDYTQATGLTGNGTTKYLRTGLIPSTALVLNDTHVALYNRAAVSGAPGAFAIGVLDGVNALTTLLPFTDDTVRSQQYMGAAISSASIGAVARGFLIANRASATLHAVIRNATTLTSNALSGGALPTLEMYVFAHNSSGAPSVSGAAPAGAYSIGAGLSAGDITAYTTHMETFQDALGRGVA